MSARRVLAVLSLALLAAPIAARAQGDEEDARPVKRGLFVLQYRASLAQACGDPQSTFACRASGVDDCRARIAKAWSGCEAKAARRLPAEIRAGERRRWGAEIGRCVTVAHDALARESGLDTSRCPPLR